MAEGGEAGPRRQLPLIGDFEDQRTVTHRCFDGARRGRWEWPHQMVVAGAEKMVAGGEIFFFRVLQNAVLWRQVFNLPIFPKQTGTLKRAATIHGRIGLLDGRPPIS